MRLVAALHLRIKGENMLAKQGIADRAVQHELLGQVRMKTARAPARTKACLPFRFAYGKEKFPVAAISFEAARSLFRLVIS